MRKKFYIFLIVSSILHFCLLYFIKLPEEEQSKKKGPIDVEILRKTPQAKQNIVPDRQDRVIKPDIRKETPKIIPDRFVPRSKGLNIPPPSSPKPPQKEIPPESKGDKDTVPEKQLETSNEGDMETQKGTGEQVKPKIETRRQLTKEQLNRILHPGDVVEDIAKKEKKNDEVNFNKFEVKYTSYFYKFKRQLYNVWRYPQESAMNGEQGTVRIRFSILKDGSITNINIISSSGYSRLDQEAVNALKTMGQVPLPDAFGLNILNVDGYFIYSLGGGGIFIR
jgi:protein TonB